MTAAPDRPPIAEVLRAHAERLMALPGVVGVGEGAQADGAPCILVMRLPDAPTGGPAVPEEIEGYPVEVVASGPFEARPDGE